MIKRIEIDIDRKLDMVMAELAAASRQIRNLKETLMVTQSDILTSLATLSTGVDTLIANSTAQDLQPIADAIAPIQAKVTAATTPVTPPTT